MYSIPRIGRSFVALICAIQVLQLCLLLSYTFKQVLPVQPSDLTEYLPSTLSFFKGGSGGSVLPPPEVYLLVPIHTPNLQFCKCLRTHLINGFTPTLVNFGIDVGGDRANKYFKIQGVYNYLKRNEAKLKPKDIIAIVDGFDAFSQLGPDTLIERFRASGQKIFTGVDKNCFPNDPLGPVCNNIPESEYPEHAYGPETDKDQIDGDRDHTRPRWVNSGTIIGYKEDLQRLYNSLTTYNAPDDNHDSDQRVFAIHYYWGNFSIALDFQSRLAVSVAFSEWELEFIGEEHPLKELGVGPWTSKLKGANKVTTLQRSPVVWNRIMNNVPVFVHFPGVARGYLDSWEQGLWWNNGMFNVTSLMTELVMDREVKIAETGESLNFRDVCGQYIQDWGGLGDPTVSASR
ncbi:hypothetical protein BDZ91DRAFT_794438 [Kalaharituber pfeilii]|nr:hypothetical protein BDZ91DRAFT_794438 [Kalaharituber pfeilii]